MAVYLRSIDHENCSSRPAIYFISGICTGKRQLPDSPGPAAPGLSELLKVPLVTIVQPARFRCLSVVRRANLDVAFVPSGVDPAICHGILHRTVGFVRVGAVGKPALAHVRSQLAEVAGDFFWN